jgi:hypothetical protein
MLTERTCFRNGESSDVRTARVTLTQLVTVCMTESVRVSTRLDMRFRILLAANFDATEHSAAGHCTALAFLALNRCE